MSGFVDFCPMLIVETSPVFLPEKTYALGVLLRERLGLSFQINPNDGCEHYIIGLPNGNRVIVEDHFFGKFGPEHYLHARSVPETAQRVPHPFEQDESLIIIFGRPHFDQKTCGLDLVASTFFMLTRWEEFAVPVRDRHGRFPASAALASKAGFLDRPVVEEYAALLGNLLAKAGLTLPPNNDRYRLHLSHDVDHPLLWWKKSDRLRTLAGSLLTRRDRKETIFWLQYGAGDPFDTFDWIMDLSEKNALVSQFNFMSERPAGSDCWYPIQHPFVQQLIDKIGRRGHQIGFHPSYESFGQPDVLQSELDSLQKAVGQAVRGGRQHYLRFAAPHTWQTWEDAGLETDSTLGYAEAPGFRCGACKPFPVFNILTRKELNLKELPLIAMDVSFARYLKNTPEQALQTLNALRSQVRKHRGVFTLLWHNSSLNDYFWQRWKPVYTSFVNS